MEQGGGQRGTYQDGAAYRVGEENPERPEPEGPTEEAVYAAITALKADYPEGMRWTNDNFYASQALRSGGYGCEGFALICSDAAFGTLPARAHRSFEAIRVGDMIRIGDYHTVVVLEKKENSVMVTEGNYNSSIHWGRDDHPELSGTGGLLRAHPLPGITNRSGGPGGPPLLQAVNRPFCQRVRREG